MSDQKRPLQSQDRQPGRQDEMSPQPQSQPRFPGAHRLKGKVALITGGDSGIGRAVAVAMAREGAAIAIAYLEEHEDAQETIRLVQAEGCEAIAIAGDQGFADHCQATVEQTIERFGRLDILVNNAAEQHECADIRDISAEQLERTFRTNVFGYFFMTQAALSHLEAVKGTIINSTSVTAYKGNPQLLDYASTRGAIVAFTRSLSQALLDKGIRVNGVAPGPIWTPLIPASFDEERAASHGSSAPMDRAGEPNEVAPCYVFLASADAAFMSGQILHPNGGTIVGS